MPCDEEDAVAIALDWCLRDIAHMCDKIADPDRVWGRLLDWMVAELVVHGFQAGIVEGAFLRAARRVRAELQAAI